MNPFQDVFISYGRADSKQFAKALNDRLMALGYTVWFDFEDIPLGVDYQKQIDDGIEKADNFLFIISPHSVNSDYCGLEVERALMRNKRIIALLHVERISREIWQQRNPSGTDAAWEAYTAAGKHDHFANMHPEIRKINWVNMREGIDDFEVRLQGLVDLLESHKDYVHQHTVLLNSALEWEQNQKRTRYLLIGEERQQAETWLATRFTESQPPCIPTDLHCEYITESIKNANNLMTQVFLCHAEADREVAEQVHRSLMRSGITTWTHHEDIEFGSDFQAAMVRGMEEADNVVFLLSPRSLASTYCLQELEHALALHKRIIPLLAAAVDTETIPKSLQTLEYINLTDNARDADYQKDISDLLRILKQDEAYHHEHKVLLTKALKWDRQQRNPCILLRGYELQSALAWLKLAQEFPNHSPTPLQQEFIAASEQQPPGVSLDVFISYSRSDSDFARRLNDGLQRQGKRTWFDQESIALGTDFQQEIYRGIEASDHFLFVLSPRSVKSPYCADEVEYAAQLNKRIVTVLYRAVETAELHPELAKVQRVDFLARDRDFAANFQELLRTLDADPEHLRYHTHLLLQAIKWNEKDRRDSLLLRGAELAEAEQWLLQAAGKQPSPTALQGEYVSVSRRATSGQQQRLVAILGSLLVAALLGVGVGFWGWGISKEQTRLAEEQTRLAEQEKANAQIAEAEARKAEAEAERRRKETEAALLKTTEAQQAEARQRDLAEQKTREAEQERDRALEAEANADSARVQAEAAKEDADSARVQAEAAKEDADSARVQAEEALETVEKQNQIALGGRLAAQAESSFKRSEQPLSTLLAIAASRQLQRLNASTAEANKVLNDFLALPLAQRRTFGEGVSHQIASAKGEYLATMQADGTVQVWDLKTEQTIATTHVKDAFINPNSLLILSWTPDSQYVTIGTDTTTLFWDWNAKREIRLPQGYTLLSVSPDSKYALLEATNTPQALGSPAGVLWDLEANKPISLPSGYRLFPWFSTFSPDGRYVNVFSDAQESPLDFQAPPLDFQIPPLDFQVPPLDFQVSPLELSPPFDSNTALSPSNMALWDLQDVEAKAIISLPGEYSYLDFIPDGSNVPYAIIRSDTQTALWNLQANSFTSLPIGYSQLHAIIPGGQYAIITSDTQTAVWNLQANNVIPLPEGYLYLDGISPDGQYAIITSSDKTSFWSFKSTGITEIVPFLEEPSQGMATFSSDGKYIALPVADRTIVWNIADGEVAVQLTPESEFPSYIFSSDNQYLATYGRASRSSGNTIQVWDIESGQEVSRIINTNEVSFIHFSSIGSHLITTNGFSTEVWSTQVNQGLRQVLRNINPRQIHISPKGQYLLIPSENNKWTAWDVETEQEISQVSFESDQIEFSPDNRYAVLKSFDNYARLLWDLNTGKLISLPTGYDDFRGFSADDQHVVVRKYRNAAIGDFDERTAVWDLSTEQLIPLPDGYLNLGVLSVDGQQLSPDNQYFSPDGKYAVISSENETALWNLDTKQTTPLPERYSNIGVHSADDQYFDSRYFSSDSKYAIISSENETALWDLNTKQTIPLPDEYSGLGDFSPADKYATVYSGSEMALWDLDTKQTIPLPDGYSGLAGFSPNGQYATVYSGSEMALWDLDTKQTIPLPDGYSRLVSFSPNGQYATIAADKKSALWDLKAKNDLAAKKLIYLPGITPSDGSFSPNSQYYFLRTENIARLWDLKTQQEIFLPEGGAVDVIFSPNGRYTVFRGKRVEVWLNDTGELIQRTCNRITRNLTVQEWEQYIGGDEKYERPCDNLPPPDDYQADNSTAFSGLHDGFAQIQEALSQPFAEGPVTVAAVSQTGEETQPPAADNPAKNMEPFAEAVRVATQAAELTQVAQTQEEWAQIAVQWDTAMQLMIKVGADHEKYAIAQDRIPTYQTNRDYAYTQAGLLKPAK